MMKSPCENLHFPRTSAAERGPSPGRVVVVACGVLEREVRHFAHDMDHIAHLEILKQGLHNDPPRLRRTLQDAVDRVENTFHPDAVVLVYGLCSRGTEGVRTRNARLVIARAQDCITHLLGSKERYADYVAAHPGTYWYSPGWIEHHTPPGRERYETLLRQYTEKYGKDNAEYLMQTEQHWFATYDRATFVDLTVGKTDRDADYTKQCADWLGWQFDRQRGDPQLLIDLLAGRWDDDRFLVLEPGRAFQLCADDRVIQPTPTVTATIHDDGGEHTLALTIDERTLADQLAEQGHPLNTRCGRKGICDGCIVSLIAGKLQPLDDRAPPVEPTDTPVELKACQHRVATDSALRLRIPVRSALRHKPQVVSTFKINISFAHDPLPTAAHGELGVAIDIGTTTVALLLIDRATGRILAQQTALNEQIHDGDNVLTRINLCAVDPAARVLLRSAVVDRTIVPLLDAALRDAGRQARDVGVATVAGNTTMLHLLADVDPTPLGIAPFTPAFLDHRTIHLSPLGNIDVHLLPGASAYVGADIVAGMIVTGMVYDDTATLLIDVGTNGEIVLRHGDKLIGCATAAGPAFEGAGLRAGCRAGDGAISHITFDAQTKQFLLNVIGDASPHGLCGSAYIDLLAEARRAGLLTSRGRFAPDVAAALDISLTRTSRRGAAWAVAPNVIVTEGDIAALMQAKAAVAAGILTLLERCDLRPADLQTCHLAGGFGLHLNAANAVACGLLPGFDPASIRPVGNTALAGAYLALVDRRLVDQMSQWASRMHVVELNQDPAYEMRFIEQLTL